jgi:hypothetical protein
MLALVLASGTVSLCPIGIDTAPVEQTLMVSGGFDASFFFS